MEDKVTYRKGSVSIEIPWQDNPCSMVRRPGPQLTRRQAEALRAVHIGMESKGITDKDGRAVRNINECIRALLDLVADAIEADRAAIVQVEEAVKEAQARRKKPKAKPKSKPKAKPKAKKSKAKPKAPPRKAKTTAARSVSSG